MENNIKTSLSLSPDTKALLDELAGPGRGQSRIISEALKYYYKGLKSDQDILSAIERNSQKLDTIIALLAKK